MLQACDPHPARLLLRLRPFLEAARYRACAPRGLALRARALSQRERDNLSVIDSKLPIASRRRGYGADPIRFVNCHAVKTWERTVRRSMRSSLIEYPMPGRPLWLICPSAETSTGGSMMSSGQ